MTFKVKIVAPTCDINVVKFDLVLDRQVELYIDTIPNTGKVPGVTKMVYLLEPKCVKNISPSVIDLVNRGVVDYVLTHEEELLSLGDRYSLMTYGTSWVEPSPNTTKEFSVSSLTGGKSLCSGHKLRHMIYNRLGELSVPGNHYVSGNLRMGDNTHSLPILGKSKLPLFKSQYHICIENCSVGNLFTEKLIDCLLTKTVPIYYGAPNISNFFNSDGFILVNDVDTVISSVNNLSSETYNNMVVHVNENYEKALDYISLGSRLRDKILKLMCDE